MTNIIFYIFQIDKTDETDHKKPHRCRSENQSLSVCIIFRYGKTDPYRFGDKFGKKQYRPNRAHPYY